MVGAGLGRFRVYTIDLGETRPSQGNGRGRFHQLSIIPTVFFNKPPLDKEIAFSKHKSNRGIWSK